MGTAHEDGLCGKLAGAPVSTLSPWIGTRMRARVVVANAGPWCSGTAQFVRQNTVSWKTRESDAMLRSMPKARSALTSPETRRKLSAKSKPSKTTFRPDPCILRASPNVRYLLLDKVPVRNEGLPMVRSSTARSSPRYSRFEPRHVRHPRCGLSLATRMPRGRKSALRRETPSILATDRSKGV